MVLVKGRIVEGSGHFRQRMTTYRDVFAKAAGEQLYPGTLNVKIDREIKIQEDFRIPGADIKEADQDLRFEHCLINGIKAFRIRPYRLSTGIGGHGDHILEIACSRFIPDAKLGTEVEVTFFRDLT